MEEEEIKQLTAYMEVRKSQEEREQEILNALDDMDLRDARLFLKYIRKNLSKHAKVRTLSYFAP